MQSSRPGVVAVAASPAQEQPKTRAEADALMKGLKYQQGEINLEGGLARLNVPAQFKYLNPDDTEIVLNKLWGNPPAKKRLGMLLPADRSPLDRDRWAVVISFSGDGYVKDDDAGKIDYADLLKKMQAGRPGKQQDENQAGLSVHRTARLG